MIWDVAVRKRLGDGTHAFQLDVSFRSDAARLVLFGPSGAGKSLTLKAVAGLLRPDAGHVRVGGHTLFDAAGGIDVAPQRREHLAKRSCLSSSGTWSGNSFAFAPSTAE